MLYHSICFRSLRTLAACALLTAPSLEAVAQQGTAPDPQRRPENAVAGLDVSHGLRAQLFASEPMLSNPTNMDVDERGRIWVAEAYNYRMQLNPSNPTRAEGDRILILEDTNGDGKADRQKVYYQGADINSALGVFVMGNRVYVSASPNLFVFTDTNGDDKPDQKEILFTGLSGEQHDHALHAVTFGPDGKLYFNFGNEGRQILGRDSKPIVDKAGNTVSDKGGAYREGMVFRMNADGSDFEVLGHNFRNNYEVAVDSYGTLWQSDNDDDGNRAVRINFVMEFGNYGFKDEMTGASWPARRTNMEEDIPLRHWHLNDPGVVPNLLQTGAGSPTGMTIYEGRLLPEVFWDGMIHSDAGPNVVRAYPVQKSGAGYTARIENIAVGARDQWFRPSDVAIAPDGSLFIADWYDPGVGGHQVGDLDRGRIFRLAPAGAQNYRVTRPNVSTTGGAMEALKSPNVSTRYLGWTTLNGMGKKAEDALKQMYEGDANPRFRARALWLLTKIPGRGDHYVKRAMQDENPDIRITGLRAARQLDIDVIPYVEMAAADPDPQLRREAAIALRHNQSPTAPGIWAGLAMKHDGKDRWYLEALGIGADRQWDAFFSAWKGRVGNGWNTPAGQDIVWRARTAQAIPLLSQLVTDPSTTPKERLRYFRAFDFHTDASKQDVLVALLGGGHPDQPQITALALQSMDPQTLTRSPEARAALNQTLALATGTDQFVELVGRFGLRDRNEDLLRIVLAKPDSDLGISAAQLLMKQDGADWLRRALGGSNEQEALAAVTVLGHIDNAASAALLLPVITNGDRALIVRQAAVRSYGRTWNGEDRLVAAVKAGHISDELKPAAALTLSNSYRMGTRIEAAKYLEMPALAGGNPLPPVRELMNRTGDPTNGKTVFGSVCASCHVAGNQGIDFGPALTEIGDKLPKEGLYTAILHPDAGISFGYEGYLLTMKDGAVAVGIIASETGDALEVKAPGGLTTRYAKADVASRTALESSLMPHGLEQAMSEQDLVDLVEYLSTLKRRQG